MRMPTIEIEAQELVDDMRRGMTAQELMEKYELRPGELQSLFRQLKEVIPGPSALYGRSPGHGEDKKGESIRLLPRNDVALPVPIYDVKDPQNKGVVFDISEKGVGIQGIEKRVGDVARFVVRGDSFFPIDPFQLEAICRWVKPTGDHRKFLAGFEIMNISAGGLEALRKFIQAQTRITGAWSTVHGSEQYAHAPKQPEDVAPAWTCPFCNMPQTREFDECPQCGIIISKYMKHMDMERTEIRNAMEEVEVLEEISPDEEEPPEPDLIALTGLKFVTKKIRISAPLWEDLEALGGHTNDHVIKALSSYVLRVKLGRGEM